MLEAAAIILGIVAHVAVIFAALLEERRQPSATMAWIVILIFMPFVGVLLYVAIGRTRARRISKRCAEIAARVGPIVEKYASLKPGVDEPPGDARTADLLALGHGLTGIHETRCNSVEILNDGAATYRAMFEAMLAARHHVHVEFYIIQPDETGRALRDVLVERAGSGIEVRVLWDAVGSASLPGNFWEPLLAAGGHAAAFRPFWRVLARLYRRDRFDFRNHRKIVVVDGEVGFTGGINIGREYLGLNPEIGEWRDTHLRIAGPAVLGLQKAFVEDWLNATDQLLEQDHYYPAQPYCPTETSAVVQIIDSGPDRQWSAIAHIFAQSFALSRERLWITNPYFVPNRTIQDGLITAALRGVDVRLLLPERSDSRIITWAASSYFAPLIEAGVKIYLYEKGFIHAKTLVVDAWLGIVGSANMDMRSFNLNFELNAIVHGPVFACALATQFETDLERARQLTDADVLDVGAGRRLLQAGARLVSPLL